MASRPRWGVFSTRAHLDPGALVPDVLLYDRLVFPTPAADDLERWRNNWPPDELEACLSKLDGLAHRVTWSAELREKWQEQFGKLSETAQQAEDIAFGLTPMVIAMSAWDDIRGASGQPIPPVPIAAFQTAGEAQAAAVFSAQNPPPRQELHHQVAVLFRRCLSMPLVSRSPVEGALAFDRAIELAHSEPYKLARRALYEWEDSVVSQEWPVSDAVRFLKERMIEHDALVTRTFGVATCMRVTFRLVGVAAGAAAGTAIAGPFGGFIGALAAEALKAAVGEGVEQLAEVGTARLPQFRRKDGPGALLSMGISALQPA